MSEITSNLKERLKRRGIRPSIQRIKVLEYLCRSQTHPTVDEIFTDLSLEIPTISKATIYNTLHTFIDAGIVRKIHSNTDAQHYDIVVKDHGHFKCLTCGEIFDFSIDYGHLEVDGLEGFFIKKKDVYYSGVCPGCQLNSLQN
ncbi:MAG TPA: Fur family transcriptional regulator [Brevefilum sp.]|nr:Fur family transcriptional regulator [Brevefilum sp.]HOR19669.1 Fur family transcriptional regulator [Brevefilum sp.]HPL70081.1 Fur family transcriptional regulator [Brevefilum sp.]